MNLVYNEQPWFSLCGGDGRSGCVFPAKGVKADGWIILSVSDIAQHVWLKQSPFLQGPYLRQSCLYLPNGPPCRCATAATHRWHRGGQTHVNSAGLDLFQFARKTRHIKEKKREVGEREESLFSQMKWKAHVAAICQTEQRFNVGSDYWGMFFSALPLQLHSGRKGYVGVVVRGVMADSSAEEDGYVAKRLTTLKTFIFTMQNMCRIHALRC